MSGGRRVADHGHDQRRAKSTSTIWSRPPIGAQAGWVRCCSTSSVGGPPRLAARRSSSTPGSRATRLIASTYASAWTSPRTISSSGSDRDGQSRGTWDRNSSSQAVASPSLGARQSERGDSEPPEPTLGALGRAERLNWLVWKKRSQEHLEPVPDLARASTGCGARAGIRSGQSPRSRSPQACSARKATLLGR